MPNPLVSKINKKDKVALSHSITIIENRLSGYQDILSSIYPLRKNVQKIGITGPPGAGKSTITNKLCERYLKKNKKVAIICVDPTSPFNGGAILGDRIRMKDIYMSNDIFIRSIASRGNPGGLADCISDIGILLEGFGFDLIIYETVGVGQIELDVVNHCDSIVLVITPESGDDIQMMKAGLIECANIIAINKSDRPGSSKLHAFLNQYLEIGDRKEWISVLALSATKNKGIDLLEREIEKHYKFLLDSNMKIEKDNERYRKKILEIARKYLLENFLDEGKKSLIEAEILKNANLRLSPYKLFQKIK